MKQPTKFKQTEIGKIPEDWEVVNLGRYAKVLSGFAFKSTDFSTKGIPIIKIKNIITPKIIFFDDTVYYSKPLDEKLNKFLIKMGDILISLTGSHLNQIESAVGKVGKYDLNYPALLNQRVGKIYSVNKYLDEKFIYYFINRFDIQLDLVSRAGGSANQANISPDQIKKLLLPMPPLLEQQAIASILSSLDSKIELNQKMNKTLETIGQALFKRWFVDFEFPNEKGKPYKSSGGEMVDSELGQIPNGWKVQKLGDCGKVICGKTPPTINRDNYGSDYPFITIPDMHNKVFIIKTERKLSKKGAETQIKKMLPALSICVSCIATPGLVSLTTQDSHTNQQINSIVCNSNFSPYLMYLTMKDKSEEIKKMGLGGTTTMNLNTGNFEKIKIIMPDDDVMRKFTNAVENYFKLLLHNLREIETLSANRDSILPKLMSGEIRVSLEERK